MHINSIYCHNWIVRHPLVSRVFENWLVWGKRKLKMMESEGRIGQKDFNLLLWPYNMLCQAIPRSVHITSLPYLELTSTVHLVSHRWFGDSEVVWHLQWTLGWQNRELGQGKKVFRPKKIIFCALVSKKLREIGLAWH